MSYNKKPYNFNRQSNYNQEQFNEDDHSRGNTLQQHSYFRNKRQNNYEASQNTQNHEQYSGYSSQEQYSLAQNNYGGSQNNAADKHFYNNRGQQSSFQNSNRQTNSDNSQNYQGREFSRGYGNQEQRGFRNPNYQEKESFNNIYNGKVRSSFSNNNRKYNSSVANYNQSRQNYKGRKCFTNECSSQEQPSSYHRNNKQRFGNTAENPRNNDKVKSEDILINAVQSQSGIGKDLVIFCRDGENPLAILHTSVNKMSKSVKLDISVCPNVSTNDGTKQYQLKIGNIFVVEGKYESLSLAKKHLAELALQELQKVCFTVLKKRDPKDLPKIEISTAAESEVVEAKIATGIGAKMMAKMGWSGKSGLGSQEQGTMDIIKPHFHVDRQGLGTKNINEEVRLALEKYSASQDYNSIAFSPDFTKEERAAIHVIAKKLNLRTRSYGKDNERFIIVENPILAWNLIYLLLESGGENEQYKLIIPTNFSQLK